MDTTPDHKFIDNFSVVLSALVLFMLVIIVIAVLIVNHSAVVNQEDPMYQGVLEDRIRPIGDVIVAGQEKTLYGRDPGESQAVAAAAAEPQNNKPGFATGEEVYNAACVACHGLGIAGAPKVGDAAQWTARIATGVDTLYGNAINGYTGTAGVMPAKGGRSDLSDEQVSWSVDYMIEQSQ